MPRSRPEAKPAVSRLPALVVVASSRWGELPGQEVPLPPLTVALQMQTQTQPDAPSARTDTKAPTTGQGNGAVRTLRLGLESTVHSRLAFALVAVVALLLPNPWFDRNAPSRASSPTPAEPYPFATLSIP